MFVMVAGRRQGKTLTAIRWLAEQPRHRVLLVANEERKHHLLRLAGRWLVRELVDLLQPRIIIADKYNWAMHSSPIRGCEIGIDDAEEVLRILFQGRVEFVTMNATLIPVVGSMTVNGDFIDGEQNSVAGRKQLDDKPSPWYVEPNAA